MWGKLGTDRLKLFEEQSSMKELEDFYTQYARASQFMQQFPPGFGGFGQGGFNLQDLMKGQEDN
jgi:hypothetical protein